MKMSVFLRIHGKKYTSPVSSNFCMLLGKGEIFSCTKHFTLAHSNYIMIYDYLIKLSIIKRKFGSSTPNLFPVHMYQSELRTDALNLFRKLMGLPSLSLHDKNDVFKSIIERYYFHVSAIF